MAFVKRTIKDRVIQYPKRYQQVEVSPGVFDLVPVTGTVTEVGTPVNKDLLQRYEDNLDEQQMEITKIKDGTTKVPKASDAGTLDGYDSGVFKVSIPSPQKGSSVANHISKYIKPPYNFRSANFFCTYGDSSDIPAGSTGVIHYNYDSEFTSAIPVMFHDWANNTIWIRNLYYTTGSWEGAMWINTRIPLSHAIDNGTYGLGTTSIYGHVRVLDTLNQDQLLDGQALGARQGCVLNNKINGLVKTSVTKGANTKPLDTTATYVISIPLTYNNVRLKFNPKLSATNASTQWNGYVDMTIHRPSGAIKAIVIGAQTTALIGTVGETRTDYVAIAQAYSNKSLDIYLRKIDIVNNNLQITFEFSHNNTWSCIFDYIMEEIS